MVLCIFDMGNERGGNLYIVYCDNEFHCLKNFMNDFADLFAEDNLMLFSTPDEILKLVPMPDVIFMDIELNADETGLDYAEKIYAVAPETKIVFITAYTEKFVQDIFVKNINVHGFLAKPVQRDYLKRTLDKLRSETDEDNEKKVLLKTKNATEVVYESAISYAESSKHTIIVHTDTGDLVIYCKLSELLEQLSPGFCMCHKSYIVNMDRITALRRTEVMLDTGKVIPVSRSRHLEFKDIYFDYIGNFGD